MRYMLNAMKDDELDEYIDALIKKFIDKTKDAKLHLSTKGKNLKLANIEQSSDAT